MNTSRITFTLFVCLLSLIGSPFPATRILAQSAKQESVDQLLEKASALINKNQTKEAKIELEKALKIDKTSADAYLLMGIAYKREEKHKDAIKQVREALKLRPNFGSAHYLLAVLLYETNDIENAREELQTAFQQGVNFSNSYVLKGHLEMDKEEYKAALAAYQEADRLRLDTSVEADVRERIAALKSFLEFKIEAKDNSYIRPKPLNRPRPDYTNDARNNNISGVVRLRAYVDEQGAVKYLILVRRLGYGLDAEATKAVRKMKFQPATKDNQPIPFWVTMEVEFKWQSKLIVQ
jgi:TonB family protein